MLASKVYLADLSGTQNPQLVKNPEDLTSQNSYNAVRKRHFEASLQPDIDENEIIAIAKQYEEAIKLTPSAEVYTDYAAFLFQTNQSEKAFQYLHTARQINERYAPTWINLALGYLDTGSLLNAEKAIYVASELDTSNPIIPQIWTYIHIAQAQAGLQILDLKKGREALFHAQRMKDLAERLTDDNAAMKVLNTTYAKVEQVLLAMEEGFLPSAEAVVNTLPVPMMGFTPNIQTPSAINDNAA